MSDQTIVQIIGAPIACSDGYQDAWRETAQWAAGQLYNQYGDSVKVVYFDLFDPDCPPLPPEARLPFILVDGEVLINGGKISVPMIRKRLQVMGVKPKLHLP